MTSHNCRMECRKFGKRQNRQRFQCTQYHKVFTPARTILTACTCLSKKPKIRKAAGIADHLWHP